jgi:hypothetical protein
MDLLLALPIEVLIEIFKYLDISQLYRVIHSCHRLSLVLRDGNAPKKIWKKIFKSCDICNIFHQDTVLSLKITLLVLLVLLDKLVQQKLLDRRKQ